MAQNIQVKIENEEGTVVLYTPVFRRLIEDVIRGCGDAVRIAKYKDDITDWIQKVTGTGYLDAFDFKEEDRTLSVSVYLIIKEELRFEEISENLIRTIKSYITEKTGVTVQTVELIVTAVSIANKIVDTKDVSYKG